MMGWRKKRKRDQRAFSLSAMGGHSEKAAVVSQEGSPRQGPYLLAPRSWTPGLPNCGKYSVA